MRFIVLLVILCTINAYARNHNDGPHCDPRNDSRCHYDNNHGHGHHNNHNNNYHDHDHNNHNNNNNSAGAADGEALLIVSALVSVTISTLLTTEYYNKKENKKDKRIIKAQPDVATYIASNGEFNSAYLEQVLIILRQQYPYTSDMELAKAIIAF